MHKQYSEILKIVEILFLEDIWGFDKSNSKNIQKMVFYPFYEIFGRTIGEYE
jgi:hypothetical protein